MADIGPVPLENYGALQTSFQQGLASALANQASAVRMQAEVPLLQQQAQGASLQNQLTAMQLPIRQQAIQGLLSGQSGSAPPTQQTGVASGRGDQSGIAQPPAASQAGNAGQTAQAAQQETVGDTDVDPDTVSQHAYNNFAPAPTAPPPQVMQQAMLYQNAGMPDQARMIMEQWTARVQGYNQLRQQQAGLTYKNMAAVANSDQGSALAVLDKIDPATAAVIKQHYANDTPEKLDQDVRDYATAYAGNAFRYSGRKAVADTGGVMRDEQSGEEIVGLPNVGMSVKDKQELFQRGLSEAAKPVQVGDQLPQYTWKAEGYPSPQAYAQAFYAAKGQDPGQYKPTGAVPAATAGAPPPVASARATNAASARTAAAQAPAAAPGAPAPAPGASAAPGAPAARPDNGLLPGVNIGALPKPPPIPAATDQASLEANKATAKAVADKRQSELADASDQQAIDAKQRSLLQQAQVELATINPRTVGPGAQYYNDFKRAIAAATGTAPNDYVNQVVLDKFLNQIGAGNVRQLLSGQKITNQEMMTFLTRGSPSTEQPLDGIKRIVGYMAADNDYDSRLQRTRTGALLSGANPYSLNGDLETASPRAAYIKARTGFNQLSSQSGGGQSQQRGGAPAAISSQAQYDALPKGATYSFNGRTGVKQ